jgi:hypothetical protein
MYPYVDRGWLIKRVSAPCKTTCGILVPKPANIRKIPEEPLSTEVATLERNDRREYF